MKNLDLISPEIAKFVYDRNELFAKWLDHLALIERDSYTRSKAEELAKSLREENKQIMNGLVEMAGNNEEED